MGEVLSLDKQWDDRAIADILSIDVPTPTFLPRSREAVHPAGLRSLRGGVVYFVRCREFIKIGHTVLPVAYRLSGIQTHNPFPLVLWALLAGGTDLERKMHAEFSSKRHMREWFKLGARDRKSLAKRIIKIGGEVYD